MNKLNILIAIHFSYACLSLSSTNAIAGTTTPAYMGGQCELISRTDRPANTGQLFWDTFVNYSNSSVDVSCPFFLDSTRENTPSGWVKVKDWNPKSDVTCQISHKTAGETSRINTAYVTHDSAKENIQILRFDKLQQSSIDTSFNLICNVPPNSSILTYHIE